LKIFAGTTTNNPAFGAKSNLINAQLFRLAFQSSAEYLELAQTTVNNATYLQPNPLLGKGLLARNSKIRSDDTKSVGRQRLKFFNFCCPTKIMSSDTKFMFRVSTKCPQIYTKWA
jgi:hypothetical protein